MLVVPENLEVSLLRSNLKGELPAAAGKNVDGPGMSKAFPSTETKLQCESGTVDTTVVPDTEHSFIPPSSSSTNSWDFATQEFPLFWHWHLGKVDGTDVAAELEVAVELEAAF